MRSLQGAADPGDNYFEHLCSYQRLIMDAASQIIVESHAFLLIQGGHVWVRRTIVSCVGTIKEAERYGVVDILPQG
jgi:hypothetical protein